MNRQLLQASWKIGTIRSIPIRVHFSWLIVFGLITWSLSTYYFPEAAPNLPAASYWIKGSLAAVLLFVSVALHELAHSFVAQRYSLSIISITLFIFGGVSQMKGEPPHPKAEFWIAIAGPLSSFLLSAFFFLWSVYATGSTVVLLSYLARINLILGVFNLIPGFPMDGGRVLRSALWQRTENLAYATQKASSLGKEISLFLIFLGVLSIFTGFPEGLWLMLTGWFLYTAAQSSYLQSVLQESVAGITVKDIMAKDVVTIEASTTVEEAVNHYFLRYGYGGYPVIKDGTLVGIVTLKEIKDTPKHGWDTTKVSEVAVAHNKNWEVSPETSIMEALEMMVREDKGRLVVTQNGLLVGLITRNGVARYIQIKR